MPILLEAKANERSTYPIHLSFYDGGEDGGLVTPTAASWSLVDTAGTIINAREDEPLTVTGGAAVIVLSGADLAVAEGHEVERRVTVVATYTSATYGPNLPLTEEYRFFITPLAGIPAGG